MLGGSDAFGCSTTLIRLPQAMPQRNDAAHKRALVRMRFIAGLNSHGRSTSLCSYSDESGHLFRFIADSNPVKADGCRSEATLWVNE